MTQAETAYPWHPRSSTHLSDLDTFSTDEHVGLADMYDRRRSHQELRRRPRRIRLAASICEWLRTGVAREHVDLCRQRHPLLGRVRGRVTPLVGRLAALLGLLGGVTAAATCAGPWRWVWGAYLVVALPVVVHQWTRSTSR